MYVYDSSRYNPQERSKWLPEGWYRVRVIEAGFAVSKASGRDMFKITLAASGSPLRLHHYIVIKKGSSRFTDQLLGEFFDCFGITQTSGVPVRPEDWLGREGAAYVVHVQDAQGYNWAVIDHLVPREQQANLPPWKEWKELSKPSISSKAKASKDKKPAARHRSGKTEPPADFVSDGATSSRLDDGLNELVNLRTEVGEPVAFVISALIEEPEDNLVPITELYNRLVKAGNLKAEGDEIRKVLLHGNCPTELLNRLDQLVRERTSLLLSLIDGPARTAKLEFNTQPMIDAMRAFDPLALSQRISQYMKRAASTPMYAELVVSSAGEWDVRLCGESDIDHAAANEDSAGRVSA